MSQNGTNWLNLYHFEHTDFYNKLINIKFIDYY